ncbi:hypothetical protein SAY87_027128 [Trapa incisa]|uniref:DAGKc domain-containing protein n=1 Tax=Trapa incisa TaxID=236973 RepID=A0AAN7JLJ0_9MYRT|nr:hypothetical protein SAY87_027128 [Trapa incisa]
MESNGGGGIRGALGGHEPALCSSVFLDHVGQVILCLDSDGLSWKLLESSKMDHNICFGFKLGPPDAGEIKFCDIYAVELIDQGLVHRSNPSSPARCILGEEWQMYRFIVHAIERSRSQPPLWSTAMFIFGNRDLQTCRMWVDHISASLSKEMDRPKNLLIFVHPMSGKGNGCKTWETVAPIFSRANVQTKVIVTERAGHAFDVMRSTTDEDLMLYDGVLAVGGDGFFNEILNGLLSTRHKASYPPTPADFLQSLGGDNFSVDEPISEIFSHEEDERPLIPDKVLGISSISAYSGKDCNSKFLLSNERFRLGIIPAGSTDAIVICTTGARDPITSALHVVLGKRVGLDIGQIVRWRITSASKVEPCVRYAASFAGYGFYGDVITESERYRWMGPKRYDYAGTKVFMRHRSYEAEIACLEVKAEERKVQSGDGKKCGRVICRVDCTICNSKTAVECDESGNWLRSKGCFLSVGAAIIANRNERAPDGLVADAHLGDGFLHLILIKDCPRALYLLHLLQLAKKGGNPLDFEFVEHHKTRAFTFKSSGNSSIWNLDGEQFPAHQLSAQVLRGLVSMFASGPPV